ncbi:hypothetical protein KAW50_08985 [candidate division WOR-3 bacterium]|nr:hypothetical protein [candidate division WOR-3 bacterium]
MTNKILIGLTGSFESGCHDLSKVLELKHGFRCLKLSKEVRKKARELGYDENNREQLQDVGNQLRQKYRTNYLARAVLDKNVNAERIIFHGIRNVGEVNEFRKYPNFYLVAVDCSKDKRWSRLQHLYNGDKKQFDKQDKRDKDEGLPYGQQVLKCVEEADILFLNNEDYPTELKKQDELSSRFAAHLGLIVGDKLRNPNKDETMMTVASTLALRSHCIKRRVGAVLCDASGHIVSAAFNEVPRGEEKCFDKYRMCYRDLVRNKFKKQLINSYKYCPKCSKELSFKEDTYQCKNCGKDLSDDIPGYKALDKCRSLHAEETTILKMGRTQVEKSILYSTTFPCLQCAKRILHAGIDQVVYIDPYPEKESILMLEPKVQTRQFEGVKALAYYKLFYRYQETLERDIKQKVSI